LADHVCAIRFERSRIPSARRLVLIYEPFRSGPKIEVVRPLLNPCLSPLPCIEVSRCLTDQPIAIDLATRRIAPAILPRPSGLDFHTVAKPQHYEVGELWAAGFPYENIAF